MKKFIKILAILLCAVMLFGVVACELDFRRSEGHYEENDNSDITGWDDVDDGNITTWDEVDITTFEDQDIITSFVYGQIIYEDITDEYASVTAVELDYKSNGKYFDGERVYELVGNKFDLNGLLVKFAIGTGVILVCVVLNVVTYGAATPVACFIAGAAQGAIVGAIKGAAMGAAMGAIASAIKSGGDWEQTLYGTLEGAADGYMWGAIFGAITGGLKSDYCFTENTTVMTAAGLMSIADVQSGDYVYSYNEVNNSYSYQKVTQKSLNVVEETVKIYTANGTVESTLRHPFYVDSEWIEAQDLKVGQTVLDGEYGFAEIEKIEFITYDEPVKVYNLAIENNHTYLVGEDNLVVHNKCNINSEYAGKTYYFREGTPQATKYPDGVYFDLNGYPRFEPYSIRTFVAPELPSSAGLSSGRCLSGVYTRDAAMANAAFGFNYTPTGYTWHHIEDMRTMILVPQDIHTAARNYGGVAHSGGASLIKALLNALTK